MCRGQAERGCLQCAFQRGHEANLRLRACVEKFRADGSCLETASQCQFGILVERVEIGTAGFIKHAWTFLTFFQS